MTREVNLRCFKRIFSMAARTVAVIALVVATCANGAPVFFAGTPRTTCANTGFLNTLQITQNAAGPGGESFSVTGAISLQVNPGAGACFIEWEVGAPFVEIAG